MNNQQALRAGQAALDNAAEPWDDDMDLHETIARLDLEFRTDGECRWFNAPDVIDRADRNNGNDWREIVRAVACDEPGSMETMTDLVQQAYQDCLFDAAMEVIGL